MRNKKIRILVKLSKNIERSIYTKEEQILRQIIRIRRRCVTVLGFAWDLLTLLGTP